MSANNRNNYRGITHYVQWIYDHERYFPIDKPEGEMRCMHSSNLGSTTG